MEPRLEGLKRVWLTALTYSNTSCLIFASGSVLYNCHDTGSTRDRPAQTAKNYFGYYKIDHAVVTSRHIPTYYKWNSGAINAATYLPSVQLSAAIALGLFMMFRLPFRHSYRAASFSLSSWLVAVFCGLIVPARSIPISSEIICVRDALVYWDLLVFLATNYVTHAATVPTIPGGKWHDSLLWTTIALLLPFAGLGRSVSLILGRLTLGQDLLHQASTSGALIFVCRSKQWEPPQGREEMVFVQLPDDYHTLDNQQAASIYASFDIVPEPKDDKCNPYDELNVRGYAIHGEMSLPKGYTWATVSPEWFKKIAAKTLRSSTMLKLSRSQSWIKMAISIAQVMFGSFTLYRSRGDQIDRFGYAAYGLSVVPYVIMSIVNLFAVGLSADYPCLYAVRTSIMEEAASRPGALFDGAICTLRPNPDFQALFDFKSAPAIPESAPSNPESIPSNPDLVSSNPGFASTEPEPSSSDSIQNSEDYESSLVGDSTYPDYHATEDDDKAKLLPSAESVESNIDSKGCNHTPPGSGSLPQENPIYTAAWLSIESDTGAETQDRFLVVRTGDIVKRFKFFPGCKDGDGETRVVKLTINAITNEYVPWSEDDDDSNDAWWAVLPFVFLFVVFGLPYVIISVMTKFKTGSSSVTQRAFMLAWLCCSQAIFIPFWVLSEQDMGWMSLPSLLRNPAFFLFMVPFAVGPILGYIAVVQMYIADNSSQASLCI